MDYAHRWSIDEYQDNILIAIDNGTEITEAMIRSVPPWRAYLLVKIAVKAGVSVAIDPAEISAIARKAKRPGEW